ncbi:MAG: RNA polymerase sigma factor [Bacteroidales bacterium]|nr:RNA polymerase sigma factor [Bacteroidales bacterium]MCF8389463.1 RNA polymerase sigma factor [Bacteroidales bacterium]
MNSFSEKEIIDGIRRRDNRVLSYVYKSHYSAILNLVLTNSGSEDDAKDIFQETLIVVFKNIREKADFNLSSGFQTYMYSIARLLWLKTIRNRKEDQKRLNESHPYIDFEPPKPFNDQDIRYSLYQRAYRTIPEDCQEILRLTVDGVSQKDIAEKLGFRSENYIKKRKHFCKQYLIDKIKEDPEFENRNDTM